MKKTFAALTLLLSLSCGRGEKPADAVTESVTETTQTTETTETTQTTPPAHPETPAAITARAEANVPTDGLALWLSADELVTTGPDAVVTEWRSPNNMRASQQTEGARPRLYPNAIGGKPAIRFDGDNDLLETNLNIDPQLLQNVTIIAVFNSRIAETDQLRKLYGQDDGDYDRAAGLDNRADGTNYALFGGGSSGVLPYFVLSANQTYLTVDSYAGKIFDGWVNGAKLLAAKPVDHGSGLPHLYIGGTGTIYNEPWAGDIAEFLVYMRTLSDEERGRVETYLAGKYGIALAR